MNKRGRPPKPKGTTKDVQTTIRFNSYLKEKLEQARKASEVSLAEEISRRLEASFLQSDQLTLFFGGPKTFSLARLIAQTLKSLRDDTGHWWHEDLFAFELAQEAINTLLLAVKPKGSSRVPKDLWLYKGLRDRGLNAADTEREVRNFQLGRNAAERMLFLMQLYAGPHGNRMEESIEFDRALKQDPDLDTDRLKTIKLWQSVAREIGPKLNRPRKGKPK